MKKKDKNTPNTIEMKILITVYLLNSMNYFPLNEGVIKIIKGIIDNETMKFNDLVTFSTIKSYSNKKISRHIAFLLKHKYLTKRYLPENQESYLAITNIGFNIATSYLKEHKNGFKKVEQNISITIVKIDD